MVSGLPEFILNVLWLLHISSAKANSSVLSQRNNIDNNLRDICIKEVQTIHSYSLQNNNTDLTPCTFIQTLLSTLIVGSFGNIDLISFHCDTYPRPSVCCFVSCFLIAIVGILLPREGLGGVGGKWIFKRKETVIVIRANIYQTLCPGTMLNTGHPISH